MDLGSSGARQSPEAAVPELPAPARSSSRLCLKRVPLKEDCVTLARRWLSPLPVGKSWEPQAGPRSPPGCRAVAGAGRGCWHFPSLPQGSSRASRPGSHSPAVLIVKPSYVGQCQAWPPGPASVSAASSSDGFSGYRAVGVGGTQEQTPRGPVASYPGAWLSPKLRASPCGQPGRPARVFSPRLRTQPRTRDPGDRVALAPWTGSLHLLIAALGLSLS